MKNILKAFGLNFRPSIIIDSKETLQYAAESLGILPFFPNKISQFSVEEMCVPGMLFGGNYEEGCWEWKGPVIRQRTLAYGKFFRRKAGFVSLELLPDFLNYRRYAYPIEPGSTAEMLYEIISVNDSLSSTELKKLIFGGRRTEEELPSSLNKEPDIRKSKSIEAPLQRLQMGGWIIISDFEYKRTKMGERYGWGVARYSTPEYIFGDSLRFLENKSPQSSLSAIVRFLKKKLPFVSEKKFKELLK
ncbi:MAG: hypothetical protein J1F12_07885 [Muribaculaceae bacterium]|nr:hypothetical protein [Muribaculaceae bacterium]